MPTTSCPSAGEFEEAYEDMAKKYDALISIHIASGISGTFEVARSVAEKIKDCRIEVLDSRFVSLAIGIMIDLTLKGIKEGRRLEELIKRLRIMIKNVKIYFIVDTLEYLRKGGRIGGAQAFLGSVLKFKPILTLNGTIDALERVRGSRKAKDRVLEIVTKDLGGRKAIAGVSHIRNLEAGTDFRKRAAEVLGCDPEELFFNETGPVIGAHTGPGLLAFGYLPEDVLK